jgi:hypothetical protein
MAGWRWMAFTNDIYGAGCVKEKARTGRAWWLGDSDTLRQACLRRAAPMPTKPKPNRATVPGSGTAP